MKRLSVVQHERDSQEGNLIYPVLSRRSKGISIGINTEPSRRCNFGCVYCEVDRSSSGLNDRFNIDNMERQLHATLTSIQDGSFFEGVEAADGTQKVMDIALSGDGEPSSLLHFDRVIERIAAVKKELGFEHLKIVVISNASGLHRDAVQKGLTLMDANNGELWLKLDAGSEAYFKRVAQTRLKLKKILANILSVARVRPVKIQTCFMNLEGDPPDEEELRQYCERLEYMVQNGAGIQAVQLYTIARKPPSTSVTALSREQMLSTADFLRRSVNISIEVYES